MKLLDAQARLTIFHMDFGPTLEELLRSAGHDRQWLRHQTGLDQPTISKLISGRQNPTLPQLLSIETALGLQRGHFLRQAGFVEDGDLTLEQMVNYDARLTLEQRTALLQIIGDLVTASATDVQVLRSLARRKAQLDAAKEKEKQRSTTLRAARKSPHKTS